MKTQSVNRTHLRREITVVANNRLLAFYNSANLEGVMVDNQFNFSWQDIHSHLPMKRRSSLISMTTGSNGLQRFSL